MQFESAQAELIAARAQELAAHAVHLESLLERESPAERARQLAEITLHLRSLSDAILVASEQLFVDYVDWAQATFASRSAPPDYLAAQLSLLRSLLHDELPDAAQAAETFLSAALARLSIRADPLSSAIVPNTPAARYLERLLAYDRVGALSVVNAALEQGSSLRELYLDVIQRVQYELGRLWQLNRVSIAQEHYCTAVSQLVLAQLYPRMMHASGGPRLIATCVPEELHELGVRMVADFFEMDGWDTTYLGANTPAEDIVQLLRKREASLLAVSATMACHVHAALALIQQVRDAADLGHVRVLVGGRAFSVAGTLWRKLGADGCANDAQQAVLTGRRLLGLSAHPPH